MLRDPTRSQPGRVGKGAFLADEPRKAAMVLLDADRDLPILDVSQTNLPRLVTPEMEHLRAALDEEDEDAFDAAVDTVIDQLDSPERRAALARAVLPLRDLGRIDRRLAATSIIDPVDTPLGSAVPAEPAATDLSRQTLSHPVSPIWEYRPTHKVARRALVPGRDSSTEILRSGRRRVSGRGGGSPP